MYHWWKQFHATFVQHMLALPPIVKHICGNTFRFILGRGLGPDVFFSVFITDIVDAVWLVGLLAGIISAFKLLLSIPVGFLDDKINPQYLLIISKFIYIAGAISYLLAGVYGSIHLLLLGVVLNGIAGPFLFTTQQSVIRDYTDARESSYAFSLFYTTIHAAYFLGAVIVSFFIDMIPVYRTFVAVIIFSAISLINNIRLPVEAEKGLRQTINTYLFHQNVYTRIWKDLKEYNISLFLALFLQFLFGMLGYVGFLFIPLLGVDNDLSLGQIAIIFAIMRVPYLLSLVFTNMFDRFAKFAVVCTSYILVGILFGVLAFTQHFWGMLGLSLLIAVGLAIVGPIILGFISQLIQARHRAEVTGLQEAVTQLGGMVGAIGFGLIAQYSTIHVGFLIIGILLIIVAVATLFQQRFFVLPKRGIGTLLSHTMLNIVETLTHTVHPKKIP